VAGHLVGLKLALLRNGLRRSHWQQQVGLVLGALAGLPLAAGGFLLLALVPRAEPRVGLLLVEAVFLLLFVGWGLFPLLSFAGEASLDPAMLALLPLRPRQLVAGLALAGCVGVAPLCTLVALAGAVAGFAPLSTGGLGVSPPGTPFGLGLVLVVAAVLVEFALCLVGSRALLTALSRWLRSRRARDLTIVLMSVLALAINLAIQGGGRLLRRAGQDDLEALRPLGRVVGWLPPGMAARAVVDAGQGRLLAATGELLAAAAVVLLLGWWWWRSLDRVLTTAEPPARARARAPAGLFPRLVWRLLPTDQRGAVAAKELRYLARHPRLRVAWLTSGLLTLGLVVFVVVSDRLARPEVVLAALVTVFLLSQNSMNQFGHDGPAYWTNLAAGADPRGDLVGKNLATALTGLAATVALAVALAAVTGGWLYVPVALCLAVGILAISLGVADVVSVRFPYPLPEVTSNLWAVQDPGQGCLVGLVQMAAFAVQGLLLLPLLALVVVGVATWPPALAIACPVAVAYGVVLWRVGLDIGTRWLRGHQAELLAALSPRRAG
jgi:ABC-2 type transport system permease protein